MAGDLSTNNNLLDQFERDAELAGMVGEKKNAKIVLLVAASAKLQKPLNINIGGSSAAGKNHLMGIVAQFIPDEAKRVLTGMSPKVLMHSEADEFRHKVVFIAEYEGVSGADYAIRTMQSEQVIVWEYVETSNKGIQKKTKRVKGPAAFIQATTRVTLHPENETRLLFIQMDESEEQTRAINKRQAADAEKNTPACRSGSYEDWHKLFRSLEQKPVRIPFAGQLALYFPSQIRSRRDFPKLLGIIEASAFLHQHQRPRDADDNIVAVPQDYLVAKDLFEHCYYAGPESRVGELLKAASQLLPEGFSASELMQITGWRKSKTYEILGRAEEIGCIGPAEDRGRYRLLRKNVEPPLNLPARIKLTAETFRISAGLPCENFRNSTEGPEGSPVPKAAECLPVGGIPSGNAENHVAIENDELEALVASENAACRNKRPT